MALRQFGDTAGIDVEADDAHSSARQGRRGGQPDIAKADDRYLSLGIHQQSLVHNCLSVARAGL
jgi:hypothetical protein